MAVRFDFSGKTALVTGASQGIGEGIAVALANAGCKVYALARNEVALQQLHNQNQNIIPIVADLSSPFDTIRKLLEPILPLDFLVNNAGIASLQQFLEITEADYDRVMSVNLKAPLFVAQTVANSMVKAGIKGSIVNVSSICGIRPLEGHAVYCMTKSAIDMMGRVMAKELGEKGIRVNSVNPTIVMTEMGRKAWGSGNPKTPKMLENQSLNRFAEVDDVVQSVLFLLSDSSAMTTGLSLPVDGGYSTM